MSSIIQPVSYNKEESKQLLEKLSEFIGIKKIQIFMKEGEMIEGIISEIGTDYILVILNEADAIVPVSSILHMKYSR